MSRAHAFWSLGFFSAGMVGAFVLFGIPQETVFPAILVFRLVSFWMPIPPGIFAPGSGEPRG